MNALCDLARKSLAFYLKKGRTLETTERQGFRAGCFVSLHDAAGDLRGCIGTIEPVRDDLSIETIENAVSAGTRDPRFPPVSPDELDGLVFEVSVLHPPESIPGPEMLDPKRYGVVVEQGFRRGVLLPDLEGVETVAQQLGITKRKAGIFNDDPVQLWRFSVERHHEHA